MFVALRQKTRAGRCPEDGLGDSGQTCEASEGNRARKAGGQLGHLQSTPGNALLYRAMARLSHFIREHTEEILAEWEAFARALPMGGAMDIEALRDHAKDMLGVIADDLDTPQTSAQQADKATGKSDAAEDGVTTAAQWHGAGRAESGFTVGQMVAEFRALRASVIRLWARQQPEI